MYDEDGDGLGDGLGKLADVYVLWYVSAVGSIPTEHIYPILGHLITDIRDVMMVMYPSSMVMRFVAVMAVFMSYTNISFHTPYTTPITHHPCPNTPGAWPIHTTNLLSMCTSRGYCVCCKHILTIKPRNMGVIVLVTESVMLMGKGMDGLDVMYAKSEGSKTQSRSVMVMYLAQTILRAALAALLEVRE